jgi:LPS-assembly lipoprotein
MWWLDRRSAARLARLAVVLAAAGLVGGCFQPLYGSHPTLDAGNVHTESVRDKLGAVEIAPIPARQGSPISRVAVGLRNALQFDLNGAAGASAPTHRLVVNIGNSLITVIVDITSGRPTAQIQGVFASYQLVEIATGKTVLNDTTFSHVDTDAPGSQQRFAGIRAQRDAEDRAIQVVAEAIRNRLASYFVAGT